MSDASSINPAGIRLLATFLHAEEGKVAPDVITVIPAASGAAVVGRDGRGFVADHQATIASLAANGMDIPMDWEHATERVGWGVERAPAAGWISELFVEATSGHLMGRITWTAAGRSSVEAQEYRYTSPAVITDGDSRVVAVVSVGLTNRPNLLVPSLNRSESPPMPSALATACLSALGLTEDAAVDDVKVAAHRLATPDPKVWAPRADLDAATHRATAAERALAEERSKALEEKIDAALDAAIEAGKVTPAARDLHRAQILGAADVAAGLDLFRQLQGLAAPVLDAAPQGSGKVAPDVVMTHRNEAAARAAARAGLDKATVERIRTGQDLQPPS